MFTPGGKAYVDAFIVKKIVELEAYATKPNAFTILPRSLVSMIRSASAYKNI